MARHKLRMKEIIITQLIPLVSIVDDVFFFALFFSLFFFRFCSFYRSRFLMLQTFVCQLLRKSYSRWRDLQTLPVDRSSASALLHSSSSSSPRFFFNFLFRYVRLSCSKSICIKQHCTISSKRKWIRCFVDIHSTVFTSFSFTDWGLDVSLSLKCREREKKEKGG